MRSKLFGKNISKKLNFKKKNFANFASFGPFSEISRKLSIQFVKLAKFNSCENLKFLNHLWLALYTIFNTFFNLIIKSTRTGKMYL